MFQNFRYFHLFLLIWTIILQPTLYYLYQQANEETIIANYLVENNLIGIAVNKKSAIRISKQIRSDFNTNHQSFKALNLKKRPFLREDTKFLLTHKEGVCGEGTRVLINLLHKVGFDATRITLYDKKLNSAHTLVSVMLDNKEFFLDSINSSENTNSFLVNNDISSSHFNVLHYSDDINIRRNTNFRSQPTKMHGNKFFEHYWLYSYEATPYTKLLTKIGIDVRVFNFDRPSKITSILAEKPNMILAIAGFSGSIFFILVLHISGILRKVFTIFK